MFLWVAAVVAEQPTIGLEWIGHYIDDYKLYEELSGDWVGIDAPFRWCSYRTRPYYNPSIETNITTYGAFKNVMPEIPLDYNKVPLVHVTDHSQAVQWYVVAKNAPMTVNITGMAIGWFPDYIETPKEDFSVYNFMVNHEIDILFRRTCGNRLDMVYRYYDMYAKPPPCLPGLR